MVLLKVFLVLCFLAYGMSLNVYSDLNARSNSKIKIMEPREIYVKSSAYLELYFLFSREHKQSVGNERIYLTEFVKRMNDIFETQRDILHVTFTFLKASVWNPGKQAQIAKGRLDAEVLKILLKKQATIVETKWNKTHPYQPISAVIFVTTQEIKNKTTNSPIGINGRIGGICLTGEKVVAVTDYGDYSGVREAARQLSFLMGAVYDGENPPGSDFVKGSDGAKNCDPNEGFLMGKWEKDQKNFNLSECTPYQHIMGLRQRGPGCYGTQEEKKNLLKTIK
uniref:Putative cell proliferation n=1 Tax=Ixodes ricinus TaxID=34613 RepID=V5GZ77_IXORI